MRKSNPLTAEQIEAAKAAFLAKGGTVTQAPADVAYGINPVLDRERASLARAETRAAQRAERDFQRGVEENGYYKS